MSRFMILLQKEIGELHEMRKAWGEEECMKDFGWMVGEKRNA
jgi:hypothetical protein